MRNTLFQRYLEGILPPETPMPNLDLRETVTLQPTTPTAEDLAWIESFTGRSPQVVVIHLPPGHELHELTAIHTDPTADFMYRRNEE